MTVDHDVSFVTRLSAVSLRYGKRVALDDVTLDIPARRTVGLIGPDGVGKSSLLALIAGARRIQRGSVDVLDGDMAIAKHRRRVCPRIAYMPQGLGKNLYPTLTVEENLQFFGRLFGNGVDERRQRIDDLTRSTELHPFLSRPAGQLSGGMKQKLALCCALIHDPDLLVLDEPTTGVDPLARSQFWTLIERIRAERPGMSVIVATGYMEEATRFDTVVVMNGGRVLTIDAPSDLLARTRTRTLDAAFISLLPESQRREHREVVIPPRTVADDDTIAVEAVDLTKRFAAFVAVDGVSFRICRGEIFGFIGSNGSGKSTTMKLLTGLLTADSGRAMLLGHPVDPRDIATRQRVGYMSQSFSLYTELSVRQNLVLHARLFGISRSSLATRVDAMVERFGLHDVLEALPESLPLGLRQRLSLAVAMVHEPELLILDEPTSGLDPIARDSLWQSIVDLSRHEKVTIFISTHFMNEAERCDRISLMHAGRVLATDTPGRVMTAQRASTLEAAFIGYLQNAAGPAVTEPSVPSVTGGAVRSPVVGRSVTVPFSVGRAWSCTIRESLELLRDPVRGMMALLGTAILMLVFGYGISLDVENLTYAVLDRDGTILSQNYALNLSGSRYFTERRAIRDEADLDARMRSGELSMAIEIPPGFARDIQRGTSVQVGAWIDGSMPMRAETVRGYAAGMHRHWLVDSAQGRLGYGQGLADANIETRYRYNPDVRSLPTMVPAVIPILLLMIPAMLAALSVVREKELGSILNLYVTPLTRAEFLLGKQLPYIVMAMLNFLLMTLMAVTVFGVPIRGSFATLSAGALLFVTFSTAFGLFASTFTRSQIAAMFVTIIGTIIPAVQFSGLMNPVSSLEGVGALIGQIYPASHFLTISRGVFNKALGMSGLWNSFWPLLASIPITLGLAIALLRKQER